MQQSDRDQPMDDETPRRPETDQARTQQAPVIRMLANPRRIRRA